MLPSRKLAQLAAAAALTVMLGATAVPNMASAAKDGQQAFAASDSKKSSKAKASKSKKHVTTKKVVRKKVVVRKNVRVSNRNRVVVRTSAVVPLVVLGPRASYRAYGSGWCRALHRGRHWAPGLGWHSGKHVGRVRC